MERTPLLPTHVTPPTAGTSQPGLQGAAPVRNADVDVIPFFLHSLTLLRTAHFPATSQLYFLIDQALNSEFLTIERTIWQRKYGRGRIGVGRLTREGENVRAAVRAWLESLKEFGEERNGKDAIQGLVHFYQSQEDEQIRNVVTNDLSKKPPANKYPPPPPSSAPQVTASLSQTLRTILLLSFTSPSFRALLADSINLTKEYVGSKREGDVEGLEEVREKAEQLRKESGVRLVEIVKTVQTNPKYVQVIQSLLAHCRSYIANLPPSIPISLEQVADTLPATSQTASEQIPAESTRQENSSKSLINLLVECLTPFVGSATLDSLVILTRSTLKDLSTSHEALRNLFNSFDTFISHLLLDPNFVGSSDAKRDFIQLEDTWTQIVLGTKSTRLPPEITQILALIFSILQSVITDPYLLSLLEKTGGLVGALEVYTVRAGKVAVSGNVWGDLMEWVLPKLGRVVGRMPLPRIELTSPSVDLALDAPSFLSTSFVPDSLKVDFGSSFVWQPSSPPLLMNHRTPKRNYGAVDSTTNIDGSAPLEPALVDESEQSLPSNSSTSFATSARITMKGLRAATKDIGYWVRWKGPCGISITQSGLLDLEFGTLGDLEDEEAVEEGEGGVGVEVKLEMSDVMFDLDRNYEEGGSHSFFRVSSSTTSLTNFTIRPHQSSHPFLLFFITPILNRLIKSQIEGILSDQIGEAFEKVGKVGWKIGRAQKDMQQNEGAGGSGMFGWIRAVWDVVVGGKYSEEEKSEEAYKDDDEGDEDVDQLPPPRVSLTTQGILIDLDLEPAPTSDSTSNSPPTPPPEPTIQIGIGSTGIVLPPESGAVTPVPNQAGLGEIVADEVDRTKEDVVKTWRETVEIVEGVRELIGGDSVLVDGKKSLKRKGKGKYGKGDIEGWRSDGFDWK